jgi:hypothetical protein
MTGSTVDKDKRMKRGKEDRNKEDDGKYKIHGYENDWKYSGQG